MYIHLQYTPLLAKSSSQREFYYTILHYTYVLIYIPTQHMTERRTRVLCVALHTKCTECTGARVPPVYPHSISRDILLHALCCIHTPLYLYTMESHIWWDTAYFYCGMPNKQKYMYIYIVSYYRANKRAPSSRKHAK